MGKLVFVGLGLRGLGGIPLEGLEKARGADRVFLELYTSPMADFSPEKLEKLLGKPVTLLRRVDLEDEGGRKVLEAAGGGCAVFMVPGDPLIATTHVDLKLRALKAGVKVEVVHAASIYSAAPSISGLQIYKFGKTVTIPFPSSGYTPETPYEVLRENLSRGLHTLILLDYDAEKGRWMTVKEGLQYLLSVEEKRGEGAARPERLALGLAGVGGPDVEIRGGAMGRLAKADFKLKPQTIIVPGSLHFVEAEALKVLAGVSAEELNLESPG
ncbi:MAG: diphthine synthase [Candidatus Hecatellaceae archaeon]|nr:MAG: diphthine synthase [Candidatus Hecatellales archaeon]